MGLDMFLSKKTYVKNWKNQPPKDDYKVVVTRGGDIVDGINTTRVTYIEEEVATWRKANHLHRWFVENIQSGIDKCGEYHVTTDELRELLRICKLIQNDNSLAERLLPTQSGFFFGGTEYDEWYFSSIDYTISILEEVFNSAFGDYYYSSSW